MKRDIARELFKTYRTKVRKRDYEKDEERTHRDDPEKISSIL